MYPRNLLALLVALLLAGCAITPRYKGIPQGGNPDHVLGITVDEQLQVVEVEPDSPAQRAGVQSGDTLVSLTWVLSEAPAELPASDAAAITTTEIVTETVTALRPPPGVENKTIPFTEAENIRALISYGVPLRLQVVRAGRVQELTIIPAPRAEASAAPTSAPSTSRY